MGQMTQPTVSTCPIANNTQMHQYVGLCDSFPDMQFNTCGTFMGTMSKPRR